MMISLKKLAVTALAATAMLASPAFAQKTIRLAHLNPDSPFDSHSGAMAAVFKSLVETGTNGSVKVQLFPNGQLGKDDEVIQQVRDGLVQSVISSAGGISAHYKMVGVFDMPFAFPNIGVVHKVMDLGSPFGQKFAADLSAKTGLKVLGLLDSGGFFAISNSKRPIQTAADLGGLRIRTMTLPTHEATVKSLGGQPTPLPWAEVYTALQTGVADGQMNPVPIIAFAKFDEVQKFLSITNHVITPYVWTMNQAFYDGLTAEERAVVDSAAAVAVDAGRGISRIIEASADKGLPKLGQRMQVNAIPEAELQKFAAVAQPAVRAVIEQQLGAEGIDMLDAMLANIEQVK
ncbi:MAG TPA: C4-dicarboxylate ABC transporter substrate-binding protein [Thauera sp.]|uniref:TRAP transporter substrate-binding protein n=1 Tax=Thauera sp. 28 TaxID=303682 RepID=UPI0002EE445E|nr:DctP family TRAP transporter solute-binding subunit [Thauera sp. 28]HAY08835.1 C4-dicarboxylate ABC transporter substrate-binding protein [Thauera sp.]HRJ23544.1 DctP family TRAP transporter solute-binding subunit [Thauera sp.]HRK11270.1 DctP family TRAP transporter solute-binding subunit [Thauera sp.]